MKFLMRERSHLLKVIEPGGSVANTNIHSGRGRERAMQNCEGPSHSAMQ